MGTKSSRQKKSQKGTRPKGSKCPVSKPSEPQESQQIDRKNYWNVVMSCSRPGVPIGKMPSDKIKKISSNSNRRALKLYLESGTKAGVGKKKYSCPECDTTFTQIGHRNHHFRTIHQGERKFKCNTCGVSFMKTYDLKSHEAAVHKKLRPHACLLCNKKFAKRGNVKRHLHQMHAEDLN